MGESLESAADHFYVNSAIKILELLLLLHEYVLQQ